MKIEGVEFVADITGCSSWTTWAGGVIVAWPDRPLQYFTRNERGEWNGEPVEPTEWPMDSVVLDDGRIVWRNPHVSLSRT